jgi:hypothetical protein
MATDWDYNRNHGPRKARIDAPGALHHIIVRGIEHPKIFYDDRDRANFLKRLGVQGYDFDCLVKHVAILMKLVCATIFSYQPPFRTFCIRILDF